MEQNQTLNTSTATKHYDDLVQCSWVLFNEIVRQLHNKHKGNRTFVDVVLNKSSVMGDPTLMREFIKGDESKYMGDMVEFYYEHDMQYRIPCVSKNVTNFRDRRGSKPKDTAIEIVTKMYEIFCQARLTEDEIAQVTARKIENSTKKRAARERKLEKKRERKRIEFQQLAEKQKAS